MMKKISFVFLMLLSISLFNLPSVSAGECNPTSGFEWCYDNENTDYGDAYCYAQVQGTLPQCDGTVSGNKCAGEWGINIGIGGDKAYIVKGENNWNVVDNCNSEGCSSQYSLQAGDNILQDEIGEPVPRYYLIAWDYDEANGWWCWTTATGGYLGDYFAGLSVVECVNDNDCSGSETCSNNACVEEGFCNDNSDCLFIQVETFYCSEDDLVKDIVISGCSNNECVNDNEIQTGVLVENCEFGCIGGFDDAECDVPECEVNSDCLSGEICSNNICIDDTECTIDSDCPTGFECQSELCIFVPQPGINWGLVGGIAAVVLLIAGVIVFIVMRRR